MNKSILLKSVGYMAVVFSAVAAIILDLGSDKLFFSLLLSLPVSMLISNVIHELGHFLFCKVFGLKVTRIVIGFIQYEAASRKISLGGSCFLSGKCGFVISDDLKPAACFFVFMGGVILNAITAVIGAILLCIGADFILIYSLTACCMLNVLANGVYHKSTDRKFLKEYIQKSKEVK